MKQTRNFTEGHVFEPLILFAAPVQFIGYFNGCSYTIIGAFGIRLPVSWLMSRQAVPSLFRIGLAVPASTVVQILLCSIYFCVLLRKEKQHSQTDINGFQ